MSELLARGVSLALAADLFGLGLRIAGAGLRGCGSLFLGCAGFALLLVVIAAVAAQLVR